MPDDKPTITMREFRQTDYYRRLQRRLAYGDGEPLTEENIPAQPRARLLDPSFVYVPSNRTDVRATWARFGFKPKGE